MNIVKYFSDTNAIHKFARALIYAVVVASLSTEAFAADKPLKQLPRPVDLIGLEIVSPIYPSGWKLIGSDGFGTSPFVLNTLRNGETYGLTLEKLLAKPKKGEPIRVRITDAIRVDNPTSQLRFARLCYFSGDESKKTESNIFANVGFVRYCDLKTTLIRRAWKANLQTGKFDEIKDTKGLVCEYGFVSIGDTDFREGCPTYGLR
jgi:hypothetical protein